MSGNLSSCIENIKKDYIAKYNDIQLFKFFGRYVLDAATFAIINYRIAHYLRTIKLNSLSGFIMLFTERTAYIRISPSAKIGPGLCINHGFGVIIGGDSILGENCTIQQGVTIGGNFNKEIKNAEGRIQTYPIIGDYVHLSVGCNILGPVIIGNNVIIGANVTVTNDVPDHSIVMQDQVKNVRSLDLNNEDHRRRFRTIIPNKRES